jgi:UMF1 family MFS transporter
VVTRGGGAATARNRGRGLGALTPSGQARVPLAWALYDFANTIFTFAVVSGAIGLWLVNDARFGERDGNVLLSVSIAVSVGINALFSPGLGAMSDRAARRLPFLLFFTVLCIVPTALIAGSSPPVGLLLFIVANFAYQAALVYYDATLRTVSLPETRGKLSGIGVGIGYCGTIFVGLLIFLADIPVESRFILAAALYGVFAIPIFLVVREDLAAGVRTRAPTVRDLTGGWRQIGETVVRARQAPGLLRFIVARFFYSDAVNTIIVVMSVVALKAKGLTPRETNLVLLALTVVAVVASVGWGRLVDHRGPRWTLMLVLGSWAVGLVAGALSLGIQGPAGLVLFLVAGGILGSGLGGVQVADRVLLVRLAPPEHLGELFGLYGLVGKGSQVIGQLLYGLTLYALLDSLGTGAYQVAVLSLLVTMAIGAWILRPVSDRPVPRSESGVPGASGRDSVPPHAAADATHVVEP